MRVTVKEDDRGVEKKSHEPLVLGERFSTGRMHSTLHVREMEMINRADRRKQPAAVFL